MKKLFAKFVAGFAALALVTGSFAATLLPVQLLNPTGSSSGQAICSAGASSVPAWCSVNAGTLGGATFAAPGPIGSTTPSAGAFTALNASGNDALLYTNTSGQSIPNTTLTTVTGWTKTYDRVNANFNASTGTFTATATGYYQVSAQLAFSANTGGINTNVGANIVVNGVAVAQGITFRNTATSTDEAVQVQAVVLVSSGQTITLQAFQSTGAAVTLLTNAILTYLSINRVP